jgi:6-phosphofructokinase
MPKRVALLTAGGYAPCLSSAVGALIETYDATDPDIELLAYRHGYHGLLTGTSTVIGPRSGPARRCCTATAAARSATAGSSSPTTTTAVAGA